MTTRKKLPVDARGVSQEFPFRFLLRWTWPDHIERALRLTVWAWLRDASENQTQACDSDHLGAHLCWLMAIHPDTPPAVLDVLADLHTAAFQARVAENPNTWATTLARLALLASPLVRIAVADNHNAAADTIYLLSQDESVDVRYAVAENSHTTVSVLRSLCEDENCYIAARARRTLARLYLTPAKNLPMKASIGRGGRRVSGS